MVLDATEFAEVAVGMTPRQGARALLAPHGQTRDERTLDLIAMRADRAFGDGVVASVAGLTLRLLELLAPAPSRFAADGPPTSSLA